MTPRLRLRAPRPSDIATLAELSSDPDVARMTTRIPNPNPPDALRDALVSMAMADELVRVIDDGAPQGICGIGPRGIGYWLGARARGRGYAREAAGALCVHAFGALRCGRIEGSVFADNPASLRVLTSLGFRRIGASRAHSVGRGGEVDQIDLELDLESWVATRRLTLRTPRLILSPMTAAEAPALAALSDPVSARMTMTAAHPMSPEAAAARIARAAFRDRPGFGLGVRLGGRLIGEVGLSPAPETGAPDVSVRLGPLWRGRGYAREAMAAFLPFAMDRFALPELAAGAFEDDAASRGLLTSLGFRDIGGTEGAAPARPVAAPIRRFALTRGALAAALAAELEPGSRSAA
ncbi:Protein N-acetyltransferase, RimJ/RimL family [Albimonas donghaensis]|uniref:Protein N-acetyltransferase, RimJ/RimL family n=2 Tax=Albimonas donghaensis TaxID=356660 RepID=A0A1H3EV01_9RHOB|nr:Protein N-acetyltransferase, RimJ/RimL family [Albimonas donghaensis]